MATLAHHIDIVVAKVIESGDACLGLRFARLRSSHRALFSIFGGCSDRSHYDLFDRNSLQVSKLLTERVPFRRDPADDAVCRSQLLRQHVEMAIESAQRGMVIRVLHCGRGLLLLPLCAQQGASAPADSLDRRVDARRFSGCSRRFGLPGRIVDRLRLMSGCD